jgi:hypothetical protein
MPQTSVPIATPISTSTIPVAKAVTQPAPRNGLSTCCGVLQGFIGLPLAVLSMALSSIGIIWFIIYLLHLPQCGFGSQCGFMTNTRAGGVFGMLLVGLDAVAGFAAGAFGITSFVTGCACRQTPSNEDNFQRNTFIAFCIAAVSALLSAIAMFVFPAVGVLGNTDYGEGVFWGSVPLVIDILITALFGLNLWYANRLSLDR